MYRLVLYYLAGLLALSFGLGFAQLVQSDPTALTFSCFIILASCWITNSLFARFIGIPVNTESVYITAAILALILQPVVATDLMGVAGLVLASCVAIASKFILALSRRHIFNPVAIGVAVSALALNQPATWWVGGNLPLLPLVLIGGLAVVRKMQRFDLIAAYILANIVATLITSAPSMWIDGFSQTFLSSPLLFAGFAMLTEPLTAAQNKWPRLAYGAIIGALSSPNIHMGSFYLTPEIAFLIGNIFAYAMGSKGRAKLTLLAIEKMAEGCYDYVFQPDRSLAYEAGQYMDWTMNVDNVDDRGNRRPFTIASAPSEGQIRLGVKFYPNPSSFKRSLAKLKPGDAIYASHVAGEFTLPANPHEKLAFIAGGIGITPFRSMVQDLLDRREQRNIVLLYGNNKIDEIAYFNLFGTAEQQIGLRTIYAVAQENVEGRNTYHGFIDEDLILREIPDYKERIFYISGPRNMVIRFQKALKDINVPASSIKVDFFPGFA
eukprot:gene15521-15668_t